jgi:hypothetical protein
MIAYPCSISCVRYENIEKNFTTPKTAIKITEIAIKFRNLVAPVGNWKMANDCGFRFVEQILKKTLKSLRN